MFKILTKMMEMYFKMFDIFIEILEIWTKIFEILVKLLEIYTKNVHFRQNFNILVKISNVLVKT